MADGFVDPAVLHEPSRRPAEHARVAAASGAPGSAVKRVAQQAVAAIPIPVIVEHDDEHVGALELGQQVRRALQLQRGVAQRARQQLQGS